MIAFYFHLFANILGQCRFNLVHHCVYTRPLVVRWLWCQKSRPLEAYVIKKLIVQSNGVLRMIHRKPIWFDASIEHFLCNLWETRSIEKKIENKITVNLNLSWPLSWGRQQQRECNGTNELLGETIALHLRMKTNIFPAKQQLERRITHQVTSL